MQMVQIFLRGSLFPGSKADRACIWPYIYSIYSKVRQKLKWTKLCLLSYYEPWVKALMIMEKVTFTLVVYGCTFCILLFNFVSYVFLLLCLCFLIVCMLCSVHSVFILPTGILRLPWLRFFRVFSSVARKCQGITRKDGSRPALFPIS
jgi:hypothetical protein